MPTMDDNSARILERGNIARALRPNILRYVDALQNQILNNILTNYNSGTLTADMARGMIGEIAGLERVSHQVDQDIREADALDEELHRG